MNAAIYSRKSKYTEKGESIENQVLLCRNYLKLHFPEITETDYLIYEDEGFSAKDTCRPGFQAMITDAKQKRFQVVICYRLDRVSRNIGDFSDLIALLERYQIDFVCVKEQFDTSTSMGRAMMYIASVFAQLERETIAERVRDNMRLLARSGRWLGGTPPTGFESELTQKFLLEGKLKTACYLKECPDQLAQVKIMFELYASLQSFSAVQKEVCRAGIRSRSGKAYSSAGIREILKNPVYCCADSDAYHYFDQAGAELCDEKKKWNGNYGLIAYNKRNYAGKGTSRNPISDWIIAVGRHTGILSGKRWTQIQRMIKPDSQEYCPSNQYALLSDLLVCKKCGGKMAVKRRSGLDQFDYICRNKLAGKCCCLNLNGQQVDRMVIDVLEMLGSGQQKTRKEIDLLMKTEWGKWNERQREEQERKQAELEEKIHRLVDLVIQEPEKDGFSLALRQEIETLQKEKDELVLLWKEKPQVEYSESLLMDIEGIFSLHWTEGLEFSQRRALVRDALSRIEWNCDERALLLYS